MNKLKKSLALIATLAIASTAFYACGGDTSSTADTDTSSEAESSSEAEVEESSEEESEGEEEGGEEGEEGGEEGGSTGASLGGNITDDGDTLSILCWTGDDVEKMIENFESANPDYAGKCQYVNVGSNGGEAREQYANYFAGGEDADLFVLEADWILDYINNDEYTAPLSDLGFSDSDFAGCYPYTVSIGTDNNGVLKAASWQSTPGGYVYRTDLAEEYLGVKSPEEMQAKVDSWDKFTETAKEVKEASNGKTAMADTLGGMWQVWQYNRSNAWLDADNKLVIDDFCKDYAELAKEYYAEGYVTKEDQWSDGWYQIGQDDSTMGYFFCTWCLGSGSMLSNAEGGDGGATFGKYNITAGPSGWAWGGSWLALNPNCDNGTMAYDFIKYFTVDESTAKDYALFKSEFVNNPSAMKAIVDEGSNKNDLLGGQDQFSVLYEAASTIDMDGKITAYDSQIKQAFNDAVLKYVKGDIASYDDMITEFKKEAAKIEGITVE